jgi:hypothetical protein
MRRLESDKIAHAAAARLTPTAILAKRPPGRPLWYSRSRIIGSKTGPACEHTAQRRSWSIAIR